MSNIKIEIKHWLTGVLLFEYESENNSLKKTVENAIKDDADLCGANLRGANLRGADLCDANLRDANLCDANLCDADLRGANLRDANLRDADLCGANLCGANLCGANLRDANLRGADLCDANLRDANLCDADLRGANLAPIKQDFFEVLLHGIPEISFLKKNLIEGKIDGSTYDGECACLSGTLVNGAKETNGTNEANIINSILSCRNSSRPIERFFLGIKIGDTPENNPLSKIALDWLEEFESCLKMAV